MNSRAYLFILPVNAPGEIPDDFGDCLEDRTFERGVFLPQADTEWFTQIPEYPARLLLLNDRFLYIIPHPSSDQKVIDLNLDNVIELETGSSLLSGWIQFTTHSSTLKLAYNTRASRRLEEFIAGVRRKWLGEPAAAKPLSTTFGPELDIKFRNLLADALDRDEFVVSQCFSPPLTYQSTFMSFRRSRWRPGHLVVLTSGNCLVWMKDEYRGRWERYAGITVSAPLSLFRRCSVETTAGHCHLIIDFAPGTSWRIATHATESDCCGFSKTLNASMDPASQVRQTKAS